MKRCMIVDDSSVIRKVAKRILTSADMTVIEAASAAGRPVSVCGEMAADSAGSLVLAALGAHSLSVAVDRVQPIRRGLAAIKPQALAGLAKALKRASTNDEVARAVRPLLQD